MTEVQIEQKAEEYAKKISKGIQIEKGSYTEMCLEQGRLGFIDGYQKCQKEHEWHKVSEVGLPKNDNTHKTFLLWTIYGKGGSPVVASFSYRGKDTLENIWNGKVFEPYEIVEWKECDLPKEIE